MWLRRSTSTLRALNFACSLVQLSRLDWWRWGASIRGLLSLISLAESSGPKKEDKEVEAKREAVLKPRIFGEFLRDYDGNQFPREDLALNVVKDMGVPRDKAAEFLERISDSARSVGFIEELKGKYYVRLDGDSSAPTDAVAPAKGRERADEEEPEQPPAPDTQSRILAPPPRTHARGSAMVAAVAEGFHYSREGSCAR